MHQRTTKKKVISRVPSHESLRFLTGQSEDFLGCGTSQENNQEGRLVHPARCIQFRDGNRNHNLQHIVKSTPTFLSTNRYRLVEDWGNETRIVIKPERLVLLLLF
jgi:hypothetical protein